MTGAAPPWLVVDSITEAVGGGAGAVVVSGSHGGASSGRYAIAAKVRIAVFHDAGVGLDRAGIAALAALQSHAMAACTVAHDSARIGEAASTLHDGVISHANPAAAALGATPGRKLHEWLRSLPVQEAVGLWVGPAPDTACQDGAHCGANRRGSTECNDG